jgi:TetR/AcrR family fatty acid metabolism transcriptional regulator
LQADKMLDAAARLFGSQRFHEVRIEDIAGEAGVGKGTIYRYFADKEELYMALLERSAKQFQECIQSLIAQEESPVAKLRAIVAGILEFFDGQPHLLDLIQRAEVMRGPDFPWQQTRSVMYKLVTDVFEEGKERGEFVISDPDTAALLMLAGMRGVLRTGKRPRRRDLAQKIVEGVLQGFAEAPAGVRM